MKITKQKCQPRPPLTLDCVDPGDTIRVTKAFSDRHRKDDLFVVTAVCNSYVPETVKRSRKYPHAYDKYRAARESKYAPPGCRADGFDDFGKVALTNLRTGTLSYVQGDRACKRVNAVVCDEGEES